MYDKPWLEEKEYKARARCSTWRCSQWTVGEKEMVKPSDLSISPDCLEVEMFPPSMMEGQGCREVVVQGEGPDAHL